MKLHVQYMAADFVDAGYLHAGRYKVINFLVFFVVVSSVFWYGVIGNAHPDTVDYLGLAGINGALLCVLFGYLWLLPRNARRNFELNKTVHGPQALELTADRLRGTTSQASVDLPWTEFLKYKIGKKSILLYQAEGLYIIFPRRWFTDEQYVEFQVLLRAAFKRRRS